MRKLWTAMSGLRKVRAAAAAILAFSAATGAAHAKEYIVNGGFESGLAGYDVGGSAIGAASGLFGYNSHTGSSYAYIGQGGFIEQSFSDKPGEKLHISFYYAVNHVDGSSGTFEANLDGGMPILSLTNTDTGGSYVHFTQNVVATGEDTLGFFGNFFPGGIALDDVSVTGSFSSVGAPGPVAGAGLVPLLGMAGLVLMRRRRSGQA